MDCETLLKDYQNLQAELNEIAQSIGMDSDEMMERFISIPLDLRRTLRPLLKRKLEFLQAMQAWHYRNLPNVLSFPITRVNV